MRGMGNMQGMMKKMKKMQQEMEKAQAQLAQSEFVGKANDDLVQITMTGDKRVARVAIKEAIVDPDDVGMIEDLIQIAVNDAITQVDAEEERVMGKYTKGLGGGFPGL